MREVYGLDKPLAEQYINWISDIILRGDFGTSFSWSLPVSTLIWERLSFNLDIVDLSSLLCYMGRCDTHWGFFCCSAIFSR